MRHCFRLKSLKRGRLAVARSSTLGSTRLRGLLTSTRALLNAGEAPIAGAAQQGGKLWPFLSGVDETASEATVGLEYPFIEAITPWDVNRGSRFQALLEGVRASEDTGTGLAILAASLADLEPGAERQRLLESLLQTKLLREDLPNEVFVAVIEGFGAALYGDVDAEKLAGRLSSNEMANDKLADAVSELGALLPSPAPGHCVELAEYLKDGDRPEHISSWLKQGFCVMLREGRGPTAVDREAFRRLLALQKPDEEVLARVIRSVYVMLPWELSKQNERELAMSLISENQEQVVKALENFGRLLTLRGPALMNETEFHSCEGILINAVGILSKKQGLPFRHIVPMLQLFGFRDTSGKPLIPMDVLRLARDALARGAGGTSLLTSEVASCFEGLARLRKHKLGNDEHTLVGIVARGIVTYLDGGNGLKRTLLAARTDDRRETMLRLLSAMADLWEVNLAGGMAAALSTLPGVRWPRILPGHTDDATAAAVACALARAGGWAGGRCGYLLATAVSRNRPREESAEEEGTARPGSSHTRMRPEVAARWLCAIGQSGFELGQATSDAQRTEAEGVEEVLLEGIDRLLERDDAGLGHSLALAQALWGLCALKKTEKCPDLLKALAKQKPGEFTAEVWSLLFEVRQSLHKEDSPVEEFAGNLWEVGLQQIASAQADAVMASKQVESLRSTLAKTGEQVGDVTLAPVFGNYTASLRATVGEEKVVFDLDIFESPVNRTLRTQQWSELFDDTRYVQVPPGLWQSIDETAKVEWIRRKLLNIEEEVEEDND